MNVKKIKQTVAPALLMLWLSHPGTNFAQQTVLPPRAIGYPGQSAPELTKFDLDFSGGTPKELVSAIQKSTGKSLNVIIPDESAETRLPALKMKNVDVAQLFRALETASSKQESSGPNPGFPSFPGGYQNYRSNYGFRANDSLISDDTIWFFYVEKRNPTPANRDCRFYSLAPYLERGLSVDDITTAIKTGAKMLGENQEPQISFHKDTKLLIAVGEPNKLQIIDAVLRALEPMKPKPVPVEKKAEEKSP
jgi:hypothetical protein